MNMLKSMITKYIILAFMVLGAIIFLLPLLLILINSFKTNAEITSSLLTLPVNVEMQNYIDAWKQMSFPKVFGNSIFVTAVSVLGIVAVCAPCAYQLARRNTLASKIIFIAMLASMVIPFQVLMVPAIVVAKKLHLINKLYGLIVMYCGFMIPFSIFLYHGFIKSTPKELEEASKIDGCDEIRTFIWVVFPLLKPITATIVIINALGIFNDFMLPLMMISSRANHTIPLAICGFFGTYYSQWNLIMAALMLTIIPVIVFFLSLQKNIIHGLVDGALKG